MLSSRAFDAHAGVMVYILLIQGLMRIFVCWEQVLRRCERLRERRAIQWTAGHVHSFADSCDAVLISVQQVRDMSVGMFHHGLIQAPAWELFVWLYNKNPASH